MEERSLFTLQDFAIAWNAKHKKLNFGVVWPLGIDQPTSIEIRFSAMKNSEFFSLANWARFIDVVEHDSRGLVVVTTGYSLFRKGIIELKIASKNVNYDERIVLRMLRRMIEGFFPVSISRSIEEENMAMGHL